MFVLLADAPVASWAILRTAGSPVVSCPNATGVLSRFLTRDGHCCIIIVNDCQPKVYGQPRVGNTVVCDATSGVPGWSVDVSRADAGLGLSGALIPKWQAIAFSPLG
jgi:hypothetical protein